MLGEKKAQGYAPTTKQTHKGRKKNKLQTILQFFYSLQADL